MPSRLSLLMKVFAISGKDLSELMHIDSSLVSKWRSGKRMLKPKSVYADKIVSHIMERDKPNHYDNICKLLANDYDSIQSCSEKETALFLKSWLTSGNTVDQKDSKFDDLKNMDTVDISIFYKFHGNKGRRQAVRFFLDYAIKHSPQLEVLSYTEENATWFYENEAFLKEWGEKNNWLLQNNNMIKVIHPVDRTYENTATSMLKWMPLHMTGKTRAFYIPQYTDEPLSFTLFLIPNHLVVFNISSRIYSKSTETYVTNDKAFLSGIKNVLQDFFDKSMPIFKRYKFKSHVDYFNDLIGIMEAKKAKYFYCSTFLFMPLSENLIKEILQYNHIPEEDISKYAELYSIISTLSLRSLSRYFINYERIKAQLKQERVVLDSFSFIMGDTISVSRELFAKIVSEATDSIQGIDSIEIGLTDSMMLNDLGSINLLVQENTYANFSSTDEEEPLSLVTKELTVVTGIFMRLEKIWHAIPRLNRNKEFVYNQLLELLETTSEADEEDKIRQSIGDQI